MTPAQLLQELYRMSDRPSRYEAEIKRIAERRFRSDRDGRRIQFRCHCTSYATRHVGAGIEVRCTDSRGRDGCGFAVWTPMYSLEASIGGVA